MRSFVDEEGRAWQVVLGRESWGRIVAILYPRDVQGPVLQAHIDASGYEEAGRALDHMDDGSLRRLLASAAPRDPD